MTKNNRSIAKLVDKRQTVHHKLTALSASEHPRHISASLAITSLGPRAATIGTPSHCIPTRDRKGTWTHTKQKHTRKVSDDVRLSPTPSYIATTRHQAHETSKPTSTQHANHYSRGPCCQGKGSRAHRKLIPGRHKHNRWCQQTHVITHQWLYNSTQNQIKTHPSSVFRTTSTVYYPPLRDASLQRENQKQNPRWLVHERAINPPTLNGATT